MRVTPIGIAFPSRPLPVLVDAVASTNRVTHNTTIANAGAAAIAAAVSAGIDGADMSQALDHAVTAAELGAGHGHYVAGADVAARIRWALRLVAEDPGQAPELIYRLVGTGVATTEAVPAALALASLHPRDAWQACLVAAGLGGDSDTVAAMAGAVVGACTGAEALPSHAVRTVLAANPGLPVLDLADQLVALRLRRG